MDRPSLPVTAQLDILKELGVLELSSDPPSTAAAVEDLRGKDPERIALVGLHPHWFRASDLAPLLRRGDKAGFVVQDMVDVDEFQPVGITLPDAPLYLIHQARRGDDMRNASPEEGLVTLASTGRRPLTLHEGLSWALTEPDVIEANACFMTIASRRQKSSSRGGEPVFDARTPALWISGGTGRDGSGHRGAPKLGWCWWRNRHTWLGIASARDVHEDGAGPR